MYPEFLENWWLEEAARELGECDDAVWESLEAEVAALSDRFTIERPGAFRDYTGTPHALLAYGLFFFPQTFVRTACVLRELSAAAPLPQEAAPLRLLDVGCGVGGAAAAALLACAGRPARLTAVDHSVSALALFRRLAADLAPHGVAAEVETHAGDAALLPEGPFDLILASFVLNELIPPAAGDTPFRAWVGQALSRLAPGGRLVILEPAGTATSVRLQRLRDVLTADGAARILAPCPHHRPCPLLGAALGYCHDVRAWTPPASLVRLNRRLFRSIYDLKHSFLALARPESTAAPWFGDPECCRTVAPINRTKGKLETRGCFGDGALRALEHMTRTLSKQEEKAIVAWDRGSLLHTGPLQCLGDAQTFRAAQLARLA